MSESLEQRVLGVGFGTELKRKVRVRLNEAGAQHGFAKNAQEAEEALRTGDYDAVITTGLDGEGLRLAHLAHDLGVRSVFLSASRIALQRAEEAGIAAFHTNRNLDAYGLRPIIDAALGQDDLRQSA